MKTKYRESKRKKPASRPYSMGQVQSSRNLTPAVRHVCNTQGKIGSLESTIKLSRGGIVGSQDTHLSEMVRQRSKESRLKLRTEKE